MTQVAQRLRCGISGLPTLTARQVRGQAVQGLCSEMSNSGSRLSRRLSKMDFLIGWQDGFCAKWMSFRLDKMDFVLGGCQAGERDGCHARSMSCKLYEVDVTRNGCHESRAWRIAGGNMDVMQGLCYTHCTGCISRTVLMSYE